MDAFRCFLFLFLFIFKTIDDVDGDCNLSLHKDFSNIAPVFLRYNTFLAPDDNGAISMQRSDTILIACPGKRKFVELGNDTSSYNVLEAHCIINSTFRVDRWIGPFNEIRCNSHPTFTTVETGTCVNGARVYGVGYKIKSKFHQLYEACFDSALLTTHYVRHSLSPSSRFMQSGSRRPQFIEGDLFGKVKVSNFYKIAHQKERLDAMLGNKMADEYISKKQFMTRGHLAARADFTLRAESRATFHYVNAAPQWQRGNAGDWAALEEALRRRVQTLGRPVTVHTGTHGVLTLEDAKEKPQEIYLHADANNNLQMPVPLYFYKLVHDAKSKTATAFVSINSSYYNSSMIKALTFCDDVCADNPDFSWLRWRSNDGTFSFCCDYDDFIDEVDYLDKLDVRGLFY